MISKTLRIGTRGSQLALYQAELVKRLIQASSPGVACDLSIIKTTGDRTQSRPVSLFETKRVFTQEIESALAAGEVDLAVHSAKDVAVVMPAGLKTGAVLEREDCRDCVLTPDGKQLASLPMGSRVGTSALRRKTQLMNRYPGLQVLDLQGNVDTRIRKMMAGDYDAIILAYAGVKRIGLTQKVSELLPEENFLPAPGQGAILVQCREGEPELDEVLSLIHHRESAVRLECERSFLRHLEGGCQLPCGIWSRLKDGQLEAGGILLSLDGAQKVEARIQGPLDHMHQLGVGLADLLLNKGGSRILNEIRRKS